MVTVAQPSEINIYNRRLFNRFLKENYFVKLCFMYLVMPACVVSFVTIYLTDKSMNLSCV